MITRFRGWTLFWIAVVVVSTTVLAFAMAYLVHAQYPQLSITLQRAAVTLIFGVLLGGVAKMLLDDFDRGRLQRADRAQFITNVLADLKAVHDRVERVRIVLPAHKSALTLDDEMQELIEARVQLKNVRRALDRDPYRFSKGLKEGLKEVRDQVVCMEEYLSTLIDALQEKYRTIADLERIHESLIKAALEGLDKQTLERLGKQTLEEWERITAAEKSEWPVNTPWKALCSLKEVQSLIGDQYESEFVDCLDKASERLRKELRQLLS